MKSLLIFGVSVLAVVAAAWAQMKMPMPHEAESRKTGFAEEMETSMKVMDREMMAAPMTGDADHDFAAMMVPHHQGAIDMAKAELLHGRDPVMRRLAQEIIADQKSEIDVMNLWLKKQTEAHGQK